jgi:hypothetical protein
VKDLAAFLAARFDEAEERAHTCTPVFAGPGGPDATTVCATGPADCPQSMADAAHIAAYDPARALMDVAVRRAILTAVTGWRHHVNDEDPWYTCSAATTEADGGETADLSRRGGDCDCCRDTRARQILGPLAVPHADHPDYDPAWSAP